MHIPDKSSYESVSGAGWRTLLVEWFGFYSTEIAVDLHNKQNLSTQTMAVEKRAYRGQRLFYILSNQTRNWCDGILFYFLSIK